MTATGRQVHNTRMSVNEDACGGPEECRTGPVRPGIVGNVRSAAHSPQLQALLNVTTAMSVE